MTGKPGTITYTGHVKTTMHFYLYATIPSLTVKMFTKNVKLKFY